MAQVFLPHLEESGFLDPRLWKLPLRRMGILKTKTRSFLIDPICGAEDGSSAPVLSNEVVLEWVIFKPAFLSSEGLIGGLRAGSVRALSARLLLMLWLPLLFTC
jgi:hypothetical protein